MIKIVDGNSSHFESHKVGVLIDVFRATTSMLIMLKNGAKTIIPAASVDEAYMKKRIYPDAILAGEKNGVKVPEFTYGNSPVEFNKVDFSNKTIIFVSTNGTRVLKKIQVNTLYIAAFLNARAVAEILKKEDDVILVAANRVDLYSIEDFKCAEYIQKLFENKSIDFEQLKTEILTSKSGDRLRALHAEEDMYFSLTPNILNFVPVYKNGSIDKKAMIFTKIVDK